MLPVSVLHLTKKQIQKYDLVTISHFYYQKKLQSSHWPWELQPSKLKSNSHVTKNSKFIRLKDLILLLKSWKNLLRTPSSELGRQYKISWSIPSTADHTIENFQDNLFSMSQKTLKIVSFSIWIIIYIRHTRKVGPWTRDP